MKQTCPTRDELLAFHLGKLPRDAVETVGAHLENCSQCEAELERFDVTGDQLLSGLRRPVPPSPNPLGETHTQAAELSEDWPGLRGYRHIGSLGRGGMGVVFEAHQEALNRRVAVKRLQAGSGEARARSRAEAETLGQLLHPNIVQIYEIVENDTGLYLILELVSGGSLEKQLHGKPHPFRETAEFIETIGRAIHHAHERGIIHRDLKPANILLGGQLQANPSRIENEESKRVAFRVSNYVPKVADFGIAKRMNSVPVQTLESNIIGTPSYMAPEQAGGMPGRIGPMTDVYSLGVILYEMLTGRVPLQGPTTLDTLLMVRNEEPVPPRQLQPGIPRDLETICLTCLQKEPLRRYLSAELLANDLHRFLDGKPILARRTPLWERVWKWSRREPRIAGLSVALVLAIVVGFTLVTIQWTSERQAKTLAQKNERKADLLAASIALDRGAMLADGGKLNQGLLWMARSLDLAVKAGDADLERAIRYNLSAWKTFLASPGPALPHKDWVWTVAFSPDGTKILTGSKDQTSQLWNARTGQEIGEPMRHELPVWSVKFSPDGTKVLSGTGDIEGKRGIATLWDASTSRPLLAPIPHASSIRAVAFSPDGQQFLTVCREQTRLWRTADASPVGEPLAHSTPESLDPRARPSMSAAFSPDGSLVATGAEDGVVRFWNPATAKPKGLSLKTGSPVLSLAFSPNSKTLLTGSFDGTAQLWDVETGLARGSALRHRGRVREVKFSNDGEIIATVASEEDVIPTPGTFLVTGGEVRLWQTRSGRRLGPPLRHPHAVWSIAFSPDNRTLATGSLDGRARFFLISTGAQMGDPLPLNGTVTDLAICQDGLSMVASNAGGDYKARLWGTPPGQGIGKPILQSAELLSVLFIPDGQKILSTADDGGVRVVYLNGQPIAPVCMHAKPPTAVSISPDGKTYLLGFDNGLLEHWDLSGTRERYAILKHDWINSIDFSPDGRTCIVADRSGFVWQRETETGVLIGEPFKTGSMIWAITFLPDGRRFLIGTDHGAQIWDLSTRERVQQSPIIGPITQVSLYPDGNRAMLVENGFAREWDFGTDGAVHTPGIEPEGGIDRLALSPDGQRALVSRLDRVAHLWDLKTGRQLGPSLGTCVRPVAFTRDNRLMAVGDTDGRIVLWEQSTPLDGTPAQIRLWAETITRMELDSAGVIRVLSDEEVQRRAKRLEETGGAP